MPNTLAVERDRFVAFAFAAGDVLVEVDDDGRVAYAAGALARLLPAEMLAAGADGQSFGRWLHEPDRGLVALLMEEIRSGGRRGPVVVTTVAGAVSECNLLRTPQRPAWHVVFRRLTATAATAPRHDGDRETGLLDVDAFGRLAEEEFVRLVEADEHLELGLVRLVGLDRSPNGEPRAVGRSLVKRLAASLRAVSLAGRSAAQVGEDRFALVHGGEGEPERLNHLLRAQLDAEGLHHVQVERRDVDLRDTPLSPSQACAALRHAIDRFAQDGRADWDQLADALGQKVADTAARVADARSVIDSRGFYVFYQPIVGLGDGRVHHHEALTRLRDQNRGIFDFVTFAEHIGFITEFDLAVAREVFDKLANLRRRRHPPAVAVNLSARSLASDGFVDRLLALSRSAGANAAQVMFEITESFQLTDLERADRVIQQLRQAGHEMCLDDFGAGAAAFHYIRALRVDYVKLDGAFVGRVLESERDRSILAGMIELCRSLEVATVAEMVETTAQARDLRRLGVDYGQGFLYGKASPEPLERMPRR
jgi:EAL domain-containing protein (putative c-di-GMP-specific phosphodiesterase class I)